MNRYLSLACWLVAFFYLSSCESYSEPTEKAHQADQPIVLTSFYPKEGGARDKILLDGKNFGTDVSKIKVYFNNARAPSFHQAEAVFMPLYRAFRAIIPVSP